MFRHSIQKKLVYYICTCMENSGALGMRSEQMIKYGGIHLIFTKQSMEFFEEFNFQQCQFEAWTNLLLCHVQYMDMLLTTTLGKFWATIDVGVGLSSKRVLKRVLLRPKFLCYNSNVVNCEWFTYHFHIKFFFSFFSIIHN